MRFAYDIFDNSDRQDYAQFGNAAQDIDTGIKLNNIANQAQTIGTGISSFGNLKRAEGEIAAQVNSAKSQAGQQTGNSFMNTMFGLGSSVLRNLPNFGGSGWNGTPSSVPSSWYTPPSGLNTSFIRLP